MKSYRLAPAARDDLKRISRYIAIEREAPEGAKRLRSRFLQTFRGLAENPFLGQACPIFGENVRIFPVGNYLVLYQPQKNGVDILQVAHGAQDLPAIVRQPPG